ncbi:MAG: hypothetical protein ACREEM_53285 [Blastocatellia bacterium]
MQMSLPFLEDPPINPPIWEQLDDQQRAVVLDKLAQLIAKTAGAEPGREESSHD